MANAPVKSPANSWIYFLVALATFPVAFRQITVSDCWWHCALGKWLWTRGTLPDLHVFYDSATGASCLASELRWEGLGDILLYLVHFQFGPIGLQMLVWICTAFGLWLILDLSEKKHPAVLFLITVLAVMATYQLQLARNSLFSMVLFAGVLHLGLKNPDRPGYLRYGILFVILLLWSFLHGSCIMGWAVAFLLFMIKELRLGVQACVRDRDRAVWWRIPILALIFALALGCITYRRDSSLQFLMQPAVSLWKEVTAGHRDHPSSGPAPSLPALRTQLPDAPSPTSGFDRREVQGVARALNSLIWQPEEGLTWSNDYWSPFEMLFTRPIQIALLLFAGSLLVLVLRYKRFPLELTVIWCALLLPALGYNRMIGYMAMVSVAVLSGLLLQSLCTAQVDQAGPITHGCSCRTASLGGLVSEQDLLPHPRGAPCLPHRSNQHL